MPARFDDLFAFDVGALCQLRVYEPRTGELIALALEIEDNPGSSVVNAAEALLDRMTATFGDQPRLFTIFPLSETNWTEVLKTPDQPHAEFGTGIAHLEIEQLVGERVELPLPGQCTAEAIAGAGHPLLALIPEPDEPTSVLDEMKIVAVADLPWAHNPWKCAHAAQFEPLRKLYGSETASEAAAGAHFFLTLDAERLTACPYHRHDWPAIARASVELLEGLAPQSDRGDVLRAAAKLLPDERDRHQLCALFSDPIVWYPGSARITNGQHRTCALKAAEAAQCAVLTGEATPSNAPGQPRRRAESTLAEYWVKRLA